MPLFLGANFVNRWYSYQFYRLSGVVLYVPLSAFICELLRALQRVVVVLALVVALLETEASLGPNCHLIAPSASAYRTSRTYSLANRKSRQCRRTWNQLFIKLQYCSRISLQSPVLTSTIRLGQALI